MGTPVTYDNYVLTVEGPVARIGIVSEWWVDTSRPPADIHYELFEIMNRIRMDMSVRVVVIEGVEDGAFFATPVPDDLKDSADSTEILKLLTARADVIYKAGAGVSQLFELMASLDRPIIAKVNGDALAFGSSIIFCCDLIVAREDARICDNHLGMGEVEPTIMQHGVVPGDGGVALVPLHMSPARAKEYLMLAREYTGAELARAGVINYAVPADELDALTDSLVERLLKRNAHALAWTKKIANKHVVRHIHTTVDAAFAYEALSAIQIATEGGDRANLEGPRA